jgi:hypothetical protein
MADPLQVVTSLEALADRYAVFEPDQVLTHGQLNSVSDFWGDQVRLSRVTLGAVGIVAGLHVARVGGSVRVTRGAGVSTDGDLMLQRADMLYDRFRPYDTSAPVYRPLYRGTAEDGTPTDLMSLHELVPAGESDVLARPLADLPVNLANQAVLMLMETVVNDLDLCSGTDCDNLGRDALHRVRFLLIDRRDARELMARTPLRPASERAQVIAALAMRRPALTRDIATTATLAERYRDAARASLEELQRALPTLAAACPEVLLELFGADPTQRWLAALARHAAGFANATAGQQVWYAFVKDLVDEWNELREALLGDDAVLLPDVSAFPKHLLLGALAAPREERTGLYPAPLDARSRQHAAHARFLAWKLDTLIASFRLPADTTLRITPSAADDRPLEDRAIPWHYQVLDAQPIHVAWNFRRSAVRREAENLGYRAAAWATSAPVREPLSFAISGHDFFRIEGHLGRQVEAVRNEIRAQIEARNLPFQVEAVLLHNQRDRIRVRPPFRYTPLHSLHYLVRQDVALRLADGVRFAQRQVSDITEAVDKQQILASTDSGASVIGVARSASDAVASAKAAAAPVLSKTSYSAYKAAAAGSEGTAWKAGYANSLVAASNARVNLGHVSRLDHVSAFDSLIASNQRHWIDWLDELILDQDRRADDRLLYTRYVQDHPGLDHLGGVWRGGTFVLVYDEQGRVVGDFTLPYAAAEIEADEPAEPPLPTPAPAPAPGPSPSPPPINPTDIRDFGIRYIKPLDLVVKDRVAAERVIFQKDLEVQAASIEGLVKGAFVPSNAVDPKRTVVPGNFTDNPVLDFQSRELERQRTRVEELQDILVDPRLAPEMREQVELDLGKAQSDLAGTVGTVAEQFVAAGVDVNSSAGTRLTQELASGVKTIQSPAVKETLGTRLKDVQTGATGGHAVMLRNLLRVGGL